MTPQTLEWFKSKIGQRVFRDPWSCQCLTCKDVEENGLVVADEVHAECLADTAADFAAEGVLLNYRDKE